MSKVKLQKIFLKEIFFPWLYLKKGDENLCDGDRNDSTIMAFLNKNHSCYIFIHSLLK